MVARNGIRIEYALIGIILIFAGCATTADAFDTRVGESDGSASDTVSIVEDPSGETKSSGRRKPGTGHTPAETQVAPQADVLWPVVGWPVAELMPDAPYLTQLEREVILHLNMARTNPSRYAEEFIEPMIEYFSGRIYREPDAPSNFGGIQTQEGVRAVEECVRVMRRARPVGPLQPSEGASRGAEDHARDQSQTGETGHTGSDGSSPSGRMERYGDWIRTMGENIAYGPSDPRQIVVNLLVDDGVPSRGHRDNILNGDFRVVGVAVETHPVYRYVCVMGYAGGFQDAR